MQMINVVLIKKQQQSNKFICICTNSTDSTASSSSYSSSFFFLHFNFIRCTQFLKSKRCSIESLQCGIAWKIKIQYLLDNIIHFIFQFKRCENRQRIMFICVEAIEFLSPLLFSPFRFLAVCLLCI